MSAVSITVIDEIGFIISESVEQRHDRPLLIDPPDRTHNAALPFDLLEYLVACLDRPLQTGVKGDRLVQIGQRLLIALEGIIRFPPISIGQSKFWISFQCFTVSLNCCL